MSQRSPSADVCLGMFASSKKKKKITFYYFLVVLEEEEKDSTSCQLHKQWKWHYLAFCSSEITESFMAVVVLRSSGRPLIDAGLAPTLSTHELKRP